MSNQYFNDIVKELEEANKVSPNLMKSLRKIEEDAINLELASGGEVGIDDTITFNEILRRLKKEDTLYNIFLRILREAISSSQEYNYWMYKQTLLNTVSKNSFNRSLTLSFLKGTVLVNIDGNRLFKSHTPEGYARAIKLARKGIVKSNTDMAGRSYRWREFIYKPAREGKVLPSRRKDGKPVKEGARAREKANSYADIVDRRLSKGGAGFWYFLNFGTIASKKYGEGGTPYPNQSPTNFLYKTELIIKQTISNRFIDDYRNLVDYFSPNLERNGKAENEKYRKGIKELNIGLSKLMNSELLPAKVTLFRVNLLHENVVEIFAGKGGKLYARFRGAGSKFIKGGER